jgi:hypothetical protein
MSFLLASPQIRTQLSNVLEGIHVSGTVAEQHRNRPCDGDGNIDTKLGRRNLIREDKIHQIYSMMQTGNDKFGMQTLNQSLAALTESGHHDRDAWYFVEHRRVVGPGRKDEPNLAVTGVGAREQRSASQPQIRSRFQGDET